MQDETIKMPRKKYVYGIIFLICVIGTVVVALLPGDNHKQRSAASGSIIQLGGNTYALEVANSEATRVAGLSNREMLEKDAAMLFVFPEPEQQCMWMKDMKFSLDMVWLDTAKKIVKVAEDVTPETYPQAFCADDTKYVLEFNTGVIGENSLKVGQNLNF
jgi:uncharacterized protein